MSISAVSLPHQAAAYIAQVKPDFKPKIAIILGSGLQEVVSQMRKKTIIDYKDLPGFPISHVKGHDNQMVLGTFKNFPVVCLQGRTHLYEEGNFDTIKNYVRTLKCLGCETLLITNSSGSLRKDIEPGSITLVTDHLNFQVGSPLMGKNDDEFGPRFPPLDDAYDPTLRKWLSECAEQLALDLPETVYIGVTGPHYETAAEIRAFRLLGADCVGMSTVPEVIIARHCGLRVAVLAVITNYATGLTLQSHDHDRVVENAKLSVEKLTALVSSFLKKFAS